MVEVLPRYGWVASARFKMTGNRSSFASPLTKTEQTIVRQGATWSISCTLPKQVRDTAAEWQALLSYLEETANTVYCNDPYSTLPQNYSGVQGGLTCDSTLIKCDSTLYKCDRGYDWGAPFVRVAGDPGAATLAIDGFPASTTVLLKGDYFAVDNADYRELHQITEDATTNTIGRVTVSFTPPLRGTVNANNEIYLDGKRQGAEKIMAAMMRVVPDTVDVAAETVGVYSISFEAREPLAV